MTYPHPKRLPPTRSTKSKSLNPKRQTPSPRMTYPHPKRLPPTQSTKSKSLNPKRQTPSRRSLSMRWVSIEIPSKQARWALKTPQSVRRRNSSTNFTNGLRPQRSRNPNQRSLLHLTPHLRRPRPRKRHRLQLQHRLQHRLRLRLRHRHRVSSGPPVIAVPGHAGTVGGLG